MLDAIIANRQQKMEATRYYAATLQVTSPNAGNAAQQVLDAEEATTRRIQGLASIARAAGTLTEAETQVVDSIVSEATSPMGIVGEASVVALASEIAARLGKMPAAFAMTSMRIGTMVQARQQLLRDQMGLVSTQPQKMDQAAFDAARTFNELTSAIGTTMLQVQQLGNRVTPEQIARIDQMVAAVDQPGVVPIPLLQVLTQVVLEVTATAAASAAAGRPA
ncbi:MAG: hypothetical protein JWN41_337 [Thermoleophilia bacterium]|nr:hypothetical protein [Thermoleophilia bacterium]